MFIRRGRVPTTRYTVTRVTLFFLAAGVWLAGVFIDDRRVTAAAIAIALLALVVAMVGRFQEARGAGDAEQALTED